MSKTVPMDEIRAAVARGWCSHENRFKAMDATLAEAIANEVSAMLAAAPSEGQGTAAAPDGLTEAEIDEYEYDLADICSGPHDLGKVNALAKYARLGLKHRRALREGPVVQVKVMQGSTYTHYLRKLPDGVTTLYALEAE